MEKKRKKEQKEKIGLAALISTILMWFDCDSLFLCLFVFISKERFFFIFI